MPKNRIHEALGGGAASRDPKTERIARLLAGQPSLREAVTTPIDVRALHDARPPRSMETHVPSLRNKVAYWVYDKAQSLGIPNPRRLMEQAQVATDFIPGLGQATAGDDLARAYNTGDWGGLAMASLGAIPGGKAAGKGLKKVAEELPMDEVSRMARAKEMGFMTGLPLYHGSSASFSAFDPAQRARTTGAAPAREATAWVALDPETAGDFAQLAEKANPGSSQQIYPLLHRADNPASVELDGDETNFEVAGTLRDLFEAGHDSVMLKNYTTPTGEKGKKIIAIRDPELLRSRFAKFDPAKRSSPDLLAGLFGLGASGLIAQHIGEPRDDQ